MSKRLFAVALSAMLVACGGSEPAPKPEPTKKVEKVVKKEAPKPPPAAEPEANIVTVEGDVAMVALEANDMMKFNAKRIEVPAGKKVKLTLKHVGKLPAASMGHNFVLLKAGSDGQAFATASMAAKDSDYIGADVKAQVIVNTKVIGGGEEVTIEFDAPAAGEYPFLCSFPGHYAIMNGLFVVK